MKVINTVRYFAIGSDDHGFKNDEEVFLVGGENINCNSLQCIQFANKAGTIQFLSKDDIYTKGF